MVEKKDLRRCYLFQELTDAEIERIRPLIFEKEYRGGTVLFFEGMAGGVMYLVKTGKVEIYTKKKGKEITIATLGPGDFVGEMSLIDDQPRSAAARVSGDTVLMVVTKKNFQDILTASPEGANKILIAFLKILSRRLRDTNRKIADL
ncbi:cyclic nucleotide-binding domain-containing protein [candidate division FCPU426 bacterium]|nr:cyclic nucleotide-binding domain-containing protein [candidate division FCPU426 bacterium]